MKCPICGQEELISDTRDIPYNYKGKTKVIQNVTGGLCPTCNEYVLTADESGRVTDLMLDFNKEVNSSLVAISAAIADGQDELTDLHSSGIPIVS